jgi:hypothetical protein
LAGCGAGAAERHFRARIDCRQGLAAPFLGGLKQARKFDETTRASIVINPLLVPILIKSEQLFR